MDAWHWPQFLLATIMLIGLLHDAHRHGKPYQKEENVFVSLIALAISITILHCGGFW